MKRYHVLFLIAACALFSCRQQDGREYSHPAYFDKAFTDAANLNGSAPQRSIAFIDSAFHAFPHPGVKDLYRKYAFKCDFYLEVSRHDDSALIYTDSMLYAIRDHAQEKEFVNEYANAQFKKGNLLIWRQDYTHAFQCDYKARQAMEKTTDSCVLSAYTGTLGVVSFKEGKYLASIGYMKKAIAEMAFCPDDFHKFKVIQGKYDDMGIAYSHLNMYDTALYYYNLAISYLDQHVDSFPQMNTGKQFIEMAKAVVYGNMGDIYLKKGDTATARKLFDRDVALNARDGYDYNDANCTREKIVRLDLRQKKFPDAEQQLIEIRKHLDTVFNMDLYAEWYRLQLEYYNNTGQKEKALPLITPYFRVKDSLAAVHQIPQVDVQEEYERIKNQYDLVVAEKQNEEKDHYLVIVVCFSVLSFLIVLLLWKIYKRTKRLNKQIVDQNSEMELALDALTESQTENTRIMQVVAHDLRNPIASMISIISLLQDNGYLPADDREMLDLMNTASLHALDMITDLMSIDITDEGMKKEPADIHALLRYSVDLVQFKASEKDQKIMLETEQATLFINREKIWRVVSNLLVNAIKFSPAGSNIEIRGSKKQNEFLITIQDHGIGIPDKMKNNVFDMFTDAKRVGTAGEKSFGLGLSISRQIIEAHGGSIRFESAEDKGTTFYVSLPLVG